MSGAATVQFLGAAGTVTGSRFLVRAGERTILVDAGLFQGLGELRRRNWQPFPVDPHSIDAVLLTHAHIDHSGWLPGLVRDGFRGSIHATNETIELCRILLPDSAHLQEEQARFANERGFSKHHPALPLYTAADADAVLPLLSPVAFDTATPIGPGLRATFVPAGHILGSASVHLDVDDGAHTLLLSGDLGRGDHPLIPGPHRPPPAHTVLIESTYGDRIHGDVDADDEILARTIDRTVGSGGSVVIPAFAVDRTELVLLMLRRLMSSGRIPMLPVFVDSPMALRVLDVYRRAIRIGDPAVAHGHCVDFDPGGGLHACRSSEESMAIADHLGPAVIVSASGMATGGRVLHHLARMLPDPRHAVVLCGFQAAGSRGRSLADGTRELRMHGRDVPVRAHVTQLHSMSVHADGDDLIAWIDRLAARPRRIHVVHGESSASNVLADRLVMERGLDARVATPFDTVAI